MEKKNHNHPNTKKMKGLFKGLRYISHVFEKEDEDDDDDDGDMQIGNPTDVKHVAHIGWDGPATVSSTPSWMNDAEPAPLSKLGAEAMGDKSASGSKSRDQNDRVVVQRNTMGAAESSQKAPRSSRRKSGDNDSGEGATGRRARRHNKVRDEEASEKEASKETSKETSTGLSSAIPKHLRRKKKSSSKSVGSSEEGSNRGSSKSKQRGDGGGPDEGSSHLKPIKEELN